MRLRCLERYRLIQGTLWGTRKRGRPKNSVLELHQRLNGNGYCRAPAGSGKYHWMERTVNSAAMAGGKVRQPYTIIRNSSVIITVCYWRQIYYLVLRRILTYLLIFDLPSCSSSYEYLLTAVVIIWPVNGDNRMWWYNNDLWGGRNAVHGVWIRVWNCDTLLII